jgi:hypothetical protein
MAVIAGASLGEHVYESATTTQPVDGKVSPVSGKDFPDATSIRKYDDRSAREVHRLVSILARKLRHGGKVQGLTVHLEQPGRGRDTQPFQTA